jgi:hypothetical protein
MSAKAITIITLAAALVLSAFWGAIRVYSAEVYRVEAEIRAEGLRGLYDRMVTETERLQGEVARLEADVGAKDGVIAALEEELAPQTTPPAVGLTATWYCGKSRNTRGSGGGLVSGESVALNNAQRREWGLAYGDRVYVEAPEVYGLTGWKTVMDTGCGRDILDAYYADREAVPGAFRRAGVVDIRVYVLEDAE